MSGTPVTAKAKYADAIRIHTNKKLPGVFTSQQLDEFATHADTFISSIAAYDAGAETSQSLALLPLYDLAILIGI